MTNRTTTSNANTTSRRARFARWATPGTAVLDRRDRGDDRRLRFADARAADRRRERRHRDRGAGAAGAGRVERDAGQRPGDGELRSGPAGDDPPRVDERSGGLAGGVRRGRRAGLSADGVRAAGKVAYAQPAYPQAVAPVAAPQPTYVSYEPAPAPRVVRAPSNVRRTSNYRTSGDYVEYRKPSRDWKKSAVIIGSSAGIGAGVGAAAGGKKGALIGAAIGGGGAAIWDQVTRRKE